MRLYKIIGVCCKNIANIIRFNLAYIRNKFAGRGKLFGELTDAIAEEQCMLDKKKIKRLCKISEVLGFLFMFGGYFGGFFISGMTGKQWEGIIMKGTSLALFFGVLLLVPQDVLDKRERDELGDFSFQSIVPSIRLCVALVFALYIVFMTWTHY